MCEFFFLLLCLLSSYIFSPDIAVCCEAIKVLVDFSQLSAKLLQAVHIVTFLHHIAIVVWRLSQDLLFYLPLSYFPHIPPHYAAKSFD